MNYTLNEVLQILRYYGNYATEEDVGVILNKPLPEKQKDPALKESLKVDPTHKRLLGRKV